LRSPTRRQPRRFGQTHQLETLIGEQGADYFPAAQILAAVAAVPGVAGVNDTRFAVAEVPGNGKPLSLHSYHPVGRPWTWSSPPADARRRR